METTYNTSIEERVKDFFGTEHDTISPETFIDTLAHIYNRPDLDDIRITMARFWDEIACNLGTYTRTGIVKSLPQSYVDHLQGRHDDRIVRALADLDVKAKARPPINQQFFCYGIIRELYYSNNMSPAELSERIANALNDHARNSHGLPEGIVKMDEKSLRQLSSFARPASSKPDLARSIVEALKANRGVLTCGWNTDLPDMVEYLQPIREVLARAMGNVKYLKQAGISTCLDYEILPEGFIDFERLAEQSPIVAGRKLNSGKYGKAYYVEGYPMYLVKVPKTRKEVLEDNLQTISHISDKLSCGALSEVDISNPGLRQQKQDLREKLQTAKKEYEYHKKCPWPVPVWEWELEAADQLQYDPIDGIMACRIVDVYADDKVQKGLLMPKVRGCTVMEISRATEMQYLLARDTYKLFEQSYIEALAKHLTPTDLNTGNVMLRPVGFSKGLIVFGDPIIIDIGTWSTNRARAAYYEYSGKKFVQDTTRLKIKEVVDFIKYAPTA